MTQKIYIGGYYVKYDDQERNVSYGVYYLQYDLNSEERRVFLDEARNKGQAEFEDHAGRNFTLMYNNDGTYTLISRD